MSILSKSESNSLANCVEKCTTLVASASCSMEEKLSTWLYQAFSNCLYMRIVRKQAFPLCSSLVSIATLSRPKCVGLIIFASNAQIELLRSGRKFSDNEEDNRVSGDRPKIALTSTER
ncbi:hypothetical protein T09_6021 [Trichinella sp. T9]|nr:hypothetical protein T09_6021 [Trichinella sp. T9]